MNITAYSSVNYEVGKDVYRDNDTLLIRAQIKEAYSKIEKRKEDEAFNIAEVAYQAALKQSYNYGIAHSQFIMAKVYSFKKTYPKSLSFYLKSLTEFERMKDERIMSEINYEIGMLYTKWEVYDKAVEHLRVCNNIKEKFSDEVSYMIGVQAIAYAFKMQHQADSALYYYSKVLQYYNKMDKLYSSINILEVMADIYKNEGNYLESIKNQQKILQNYEKLRNIEGEFATLNNLGFLYKFLNNTDKSLEYFTKALTKSDNHHLNASLLLNIGIIHYNKHDFESALSYFFKALKIRRSERDLKEVAHINNLLASTYFQIQDFESAINFSKMAIDIGLKIENNDILYQSYLISSDIYRAGGNFEVALEYYQKYSTIKDKLKANDQVQQTKLLSKQYFIDKTEKELKLYKSEAEVKDLTLKQLVLEKEKKDKELAFLVESEKMQKKQYELEKASAENRYLLANRKLEAEKKDREITELNKDREIKVYQLKQKEIEKKEKEKTIELLEQDKILKQLEVNEGKLYRNIFIVAFISILFIAILILYNFIKKKRLNKKLKQQNEEIFLQNIEIKEQKVSIEQQAEELQQMNENLIKLDNFKESLTGMIVHDLKNPLNTLLNISNDKKVQQSAKQMLLMVMNILDIQKFEDAALKLELTPSALFSKAEEAVDQVCVPAREKNIKIQNNIPLAYTVKMDREITERVFVNLLTNAIKYTPVNGSIILDVKPYQSDIIRIEVSDNGEGIPDDKQHLVFEKFGQIEARKIGKVRSTGLGLTFCKMAIEAHGGDIGVESTEGEGATFWFTMRKSDDILPEEQKKEVKKVLPQFELSEKSYSYLKPFMERFSKYKYYEITELRKIIAKIDDAAGMEVKAWKEKIVDTITTGNKDRYLELINMKPSGENVRAEIPKNITVDKELPLTRSVETNTYLISFVTELRKYKYYEISELRKIINRIDENVNEEVKNWKDDLLNAIKAGNKVYYEDLTKLNNYE